MKQFLETKPRGTDAFPCSHYDHSGIKHKVSLHWHPEIELLYGIEGELAVNVGEETSLLHAGEVLFISPDELHTFLARSDWVHYHAAVFDLSLFRFQAPHFFETLFTAPIASGEFKLPRMITAEHPQYHLIQPIVHRLFCEDISSNALAFADLSALFAVLLEHRLLVQAGEADVKIEGIKKCLAYMEAHLHEPIPLNDLAELVHLSPNYFCTYFKKYTGVTPFAKLHQIRLKKAAKLLRHSDAAISEIAEACGFETVSFFIRKFKERYNCTPAVYRKEKST